MAKIIPIKNVPPPPTFDDDDDDLLVMKAAETQKQRIVRDAHSATPFRLQFAFWLNMSKPGEEAIADTIETLKQQRTFARTIRDGIRLICDLRAGKLDVLFELFPWVRAEFLEYMQSLQPTKSAADTALQAQLARLESLLLAGNIESGGGPKPLNVAKVPGPIVDDDMPELEIKKAKSTGNASENFLKSAFAVAGIQ